MDIINPKTTTKIAKQRSINHIPLKDRKMGVKTQIFKKKARKKSLMFRWDIPGAFLRIWLFYTEHKIISTYKLLYLEYSILKFQKPL